MPTEPGEYFWQWRIHEDEWTDEHPVVLNNDDSYRSIDYLGGRHEDRQVAGYDGDQDVRFRRRWTQEGPAAT